MACGEKQFRVEPANAFFGRRHKTCIDLEGSSAVALDGKHFLISSVSTDYYVWFNLDDSSTDPAVAERTAIEVDIALADSALGVAAKLKSAIDAVVSGTDKEFYSDLETGGCVCVETFKLGEANSASADGDTGLKVTTELIGSFSDLGSLAEDFDFAPEVSETDITSHQDGETPIDKVITGFALDIELGLLDTSKERIRELVGQGIGSTYTPTGGTELIGLGSSSLGRSSFDIGGELRIVPVNDASRAFIFPLAVAKLSSLSYSSVEKQVLTMNFSVLLDRKVRPEVNFAYCGEVDQDIR